MLIGILGLLMVNKMLLKKNHLNLRQQGKLQTRAWKEPPSFILGQGQTDNEFVCAGGAV